MVWRSREKKSAHLPGSSEPISERPRTRAPPRVASSTTSRAVIHSSARTGCDCERNIYLRGPSGGSNPSRNRANSMAWRASSKMLDASLLDEPSTTRPTLTPAAMYFFIGVMQEPRGRLDHGQLAAAPAVEANLLIYLS